MTILLLQEAMVLLASYQLDVLDAKPSSLALLRSSLVLVAEVLHHSLSR